MYADPVLLKQVWMNLIDYALKFSSKAAQPKVSIECEKTGRFYSFSVRDNGAGFDKKYADSQVDAHQAALNLLQRYAQDGDTPALKSFAAATAPKVQEHLNMAEGLKKGFDTGEDVAKDNAQH